MTPSLVGEEGLLQGTSLIFEESSSLKEGEKLSWTVGRDPDACQLILDDPSVSRKQLVIIKEGNLYTAASLAETNPVELNDQLLEGVAELKDGDTLKLGSTLFRFKLEEKIPEEKETASIENPAANEEISRESVLEDNWEEKQPAPQFPEVNFDIVETSRFLLKVIAGPNSGAEFAMEPNNVYLVGTDPNSCDIVFHDTSVSRQHLRITFMEDESLYVEDLNSRNGTLVDGQSVKEKQKIASNEIVTLGTTSFVIYDREGNMHTLISPLLPSIVKVLQKETEDKDQAAAASTPAADTPIKEPAELTPPPSTQSMGALVLIAIVTGVIVITAIGTTTLFKTEQITAPEVIHPEQAITDALASYPTIKFSFNKTSGRLVLFGHLISAQDKTQMLYGVNTFPFIKSIDDSGVIIDEYVWREANQILNKNPAWKTISIQSPSPGVFVLSGTLQTRKQADQLFEYVSSNFPFLDRLEKKVTVEEEVVDEVKTSLTNLGIINPKVTFVNGEVTVAGGVPAEKQAALDQLIEKFKSIPGIRAVRMQINPLSGPQATINVSDKYEVSGFSRSGNTLSVVINGRIVSKGDVIDGMTLQEISPTTIFLEKDGVKYRIDYSR